MNDNIERSPNVPPFVTFVTSAVPMVFDNSMSYYEALCALWKYLQDDVVDVINNNATVTEEYIQLTNDLEEYMNNYFDNLDVQNEINNKLDEMAENGTLTALIKAYVDPYIEAQNNAISLFKTQVNGEISSFETDVNTDIGNLTSRVNGIASGSPLVASSTSEMTDTTRVYVNTTDGYWYYYDGTNWTQGGTYQSAVDPTLDTQNTYLRDKALNNEFGKNLFNKNNKNIYNNHILRGANYTANNSYACSHPILVEEGVEYKFTSNWAKIGNDTKEVAFINPDYSVISHNTGTLNADNTVVTWTAPKNGYVTVNVGYNTAANYEVFKFAKSSDFDTAQNYEYKNGDLKTSLNNTYDYLTLDKIDTLITSDNLYDKTSKLNTTGKMIGQSGYSDYSNGIVSHPIYFKKGDVVRCYHNSNYGNNICIAKCTKDGEFIEIVNGSLDSSVITNTIPETGFYRFNVNVNDSEFMVVKNMEYPAEYIEYSADLYNVHLPYIDELEITQSPLYGKTISLNGDSICYGAGYVGGYGKIIGEKFNMTYENLAESGATITSGTTYAGGGNRYWINEHISDMNAYDYGIVEGGVNDSSLSVPLGSISNGYSATLDTNTFYGAFENMLKQLIQKFAGKKYGYIMVHQMSANMRISNDPATSYYWAARKCCEKWGVPFLDLNDKVPPFAFLNNTSLESLSDAYTLNGDGWHPNEDGYKKYYVDKITAWLESL